MVKDYFSSNETIDYYIERLQKLHIMYNSNINNYEELGDEDFECWLNFMLKQYLKDNKEVVE